MKFNKLRSLLLLLVVSGLLSCQTSSQKNRISPEEQSAYISKGKNITMRSFRAFSKEVMNALNEGGVQHAVGYCHQQAGSLIDSLEKVNQVKISRVSDKYRNPKNKPGLLDMTVIETYQEQLSKGEELQSHLEITRDEVVFYSPILILNPVCLNCHGETGSSLETGNFEYIKSLYPEDLATGYKLGDLRGVWKIVFINPGQK
jgi:hypothetical protein